jgi:hypothetical protein
MRTIATALSVAVLVGGFWAPGEGAQVGGPKPKEVPVLVAWGGMVDHALTAKVPGHIRTQAEWEKLWKLWRKGEPVPFVNFEEALVLVACSGDQNAVAVMPRLSAAGDLQVAVATTLLESTNSKTSGYQLAVISRQGIKTIDGKALDKK